MPSRIAAFTAGLAMVSAVSIGGTLASSSAHAAVTETFNGFSEDDPLNNARVLNNTATLTGGGLPGNPQNIPGFITVYDTSESGNPDPDLFAAGNPPNNPNPNGSQEVLIREGGTNGSNVIPPRPNDNQSGSFFQFEFDSPVDLLSLDILDIEESAGVTLFGNGTQINGPGPGGTFSCSSDGCFQTIAFGALNNTTDLNTLRVELAGSGAIDNLVVTPLPAAIFMFAASLLGLGALRQRWRRKTEGVIGDPVAA